MSVEIKTGWCMVIKSSRKPKGHQPNLKRHRHPKMVSLYHLLITSRSNIQKTKTNWFEFNILNANVQGRIF